MLKFHNHISRSVTRPGEGNNVLCTFTSSRELGFNNNILSDVSDEVFSFNTSKQPLNFNIVTHLSIFYTPNLRSLFLSLSLLSSSATWLFNFVSLFFLLSQFLEQELDLPGQ